MGAGERCAGRDAARHSHRVGLRVGQDAPDSQASRRSLPEAPPCRGRCTRLRWGAAQLSSSSKGRGSSTGGEGVGGNQVGTRGEAGRQRLAAMLTAGGGRADSGGELSMANRRGTGNAPQGSKTSSVLRRGHS